MNHQNTTLFKFRYHGSMHALDAFCNDLRAAGIADQIDCNKEKSLLRVAGAKNRTAAECIAIASRHDLRLSEIVSADTDLERTVTVPISGMTCSSCEVLIEQKFKALPGVTRVSVSAHTQSAHLVCAGPVPSAHAFQKALGEGKYRIGRLGEKAAQRIRPSFARLLGVFSLALLVLVLLSKAGVFTLSASLETGASLGAVFVMGLVAATSSCLATVGGLLISSVAESEKRRGPTLLFMAGRLLSYAVFGGLIGLLGSALSLSPAVTGFIMLLAALYMVVMGLDMLGILPGWMKLFLPTLPKGISSRLLSRSGNPHAFAPLFAGAATFFVPCGFTQSLQLYALTTGSPVTSALVLFVFALGTSPALTALGFAMDFFSGKRRELFLQFAGSLVFLMGFGTIQNAFTIAGHPISFDWVRNAFAAQGRSDASLPPLENGVQLLRMSAVPGGYEPSRLTVRAGIPVRWSVDGTRAAGCMVAFQAPQLGIKKILEQGENIFEFTAPKPGTYAFSCSMGMYRGAITAI